MKVLVTGGAGYIGSHTAVELIKNGHSVVVVDSLINSKSQAIARIESITKTKIPFYKLDMAHSKNLKKIFDEHSFDAVVHFAGLKSVSESVEQPVYYYQNNLFSTLSLLETMREASVKKLVFSSSATVYDLSQKSPLKETDRIGTNIQNPYGQTKFMIEQMLSDLANSDRSWQICSLRYFNPIGAHPSGLIGEDPNDIPNNLLPYILQVAIGKLKVLKVFGNDYNTSDGTGVRDYIHVMDLAEGHLAALTQMQLGYTAYNLGTGRGTSVLELIKIFEKSSGIKINFEITTRRQGDADICFADVSLACNKLKWQAERTIFEACQDSWRWQSSNPTGYV